MKKIKLLAPILTAITLSSGLIPMVSCNPGAKPEVNPYFEDIADEQKKGKVDDAFDYYVYTLTLKEKLDLGSTLTINLEHVSGVEVELGSFVQPTGLEVAIPVKLKNVQNTDTIEAKFNINVICNGVWET
ncbi:MAG: hypothetical protein MJ233_04315 [Mycoplasmoidaceae bacterium]|nr:hypothetical protein [Mycoplasmoidaceae bacterium]